ncbi:MULTISPECIES: GntP family permease [unclassified Novosphingobium]|uniref:GntP family permease n=1 Tax=unclassified Novosphingobium TaxID=2644732 RepID=UPI00086C9C96|nr:MULTISPECIES: gluconate:H+ symporter [unclassified Novosphingobium]MBN9142889.1 gluconate permease [Novosphingobium sp.]MDR6705974.1 GntP family gluconate:H+ symporter [Novosphingobium sp. 1748]ODU84957.1 MAG: gluconate permease [Novosphingobium sp. SCN 63-17]OJX89262.1 MAG: gluconate permease [Novosphingobium sp. 63-713]
MLAADIWLLGISIGGIALAILLIARLGLHPFLGLLTGALVTGLAAQLPPDKLAQTIEKGFGDILRGTGMVVALGLGLGAMLQISGGARALAKAVLDRTGDRYATLGGLAAALLIGMPLFFETGTVLLLPIIAAGMADRAQSGSLRLRVMLSTLAGLSVLHALMPPHPGPLIAVRELGADPARTMLLGLIAAIPTALIAGPLLARITTRGVVTENLPLIEPDEGLATPAWRALIVLLLPVGLIAAGALMRMGGGELPPAIALVSDPVVALLIANGAGLALLLGPRMADRTLQDMIWREAMLPAGGILLGIGAGGALKQVLVDIGLPALFARLAQANFVGPVVMAWLVAAAIRVATGSATVATITASAIMAGVVGGHQIDPSLIVMAIGAGSVFFSHVNDPGFWLVKAYLGTSTRDTFRTWSMLESAISVVGLGCVLLLAQVV